MQVTQEDLSASRPPPKRQRSLNITTPGIPWYRDIKILRLVAQVIFAILMLGSGFGLVSNLLSNLRSSNLSLDFNIYSKPFSVALSEGTSLTSDWSWIDEQNTLAFMIGVLWLAAFGLIIYYGLRTYRHTQELPYLHIVAGGAVLLFILINPPMSLADDATVTLNRYFSGGTVTRAFVTGIFNTLRVVFFSLIACTLLGIGAGVALLSKNYLLRSAAKVYVEIFRNTPLVVQLFFIYRTLVLILPFPRQSIFSPDQIGPIKLENSLYVFNARGFYFAAPDPTDTANIFYIGMMIAIVVGWYIRRRRLIYQEETGQPANTWRIVVPIMLGICAVSWVIAGRPFDVNYPALTGPNIQGGTQLTISFMSLFLGLTLYTAAFIAEIVRAGIQSVPYGQIEAARSQGLRGSEVLNLVVLPQALRLIIPPLGNQYVNLGKNSSLGIIVNYADTFRVAQLANNESGQAVPFFVGLMVIYLVLSNILSVLTNFVNQATRVKTR